MKPLIDTHAHMADPVFDRDRAEVLARARAAGVAAVVAVAENLEEARRVLELAATHQGIAAAAGLYPAHLDPEQAEELIRFIRHHGRDLVGIGEVGLDYWLAKEEPQREIQRAILSRFVDLSQELDLPLNVHSRSAGRYAVELLLARGAVKVQLHAFDGRASSAMPAVEAGYLFSIPPSVLRSQQKRKLVRGLPLSSLLVETDSPVLGPARGERNEPANAVLSVKAIAELKGLEPEEVREAVYENSLRLYGPRLFA